ncbi:MAG TPA: DUF748 domain-containing protein [Nitrospira sp.]|nr:DUF748 domain-containing protein [Nitrospira sp.]
MRKFLRPIPLAISALTLLLVYTLVGFFLIPYVIKAHVLPAVSDQLHRPVTVKEVQFNPFVLSLKMTGFEIQEQDATPIIGFDELFINFQTSSLLRRAYVFDEIRFAMPYVSIKVGKDGHVNVAELAPSKKAPAPSGESTVTATEPAASSEAPGPAPEPPASLPAVEIGRFEIAQGVVEFHDASKPHPVSVDVVPINLVLSNFHTKPGGDNTYSFMAELGKDEILDWKGTISLEPVASEGTLSLSGVRVATVFQYVRDQFPFDIPTGNIRAIGRYRLATAPSLDLEVSDTLLHLTDIGIIEKGDPDPVIDLHTLFLDGIHADLRERKLEIASLTMDKGRERIWRNSDGSLNLQNLFIPAKAATTEEATPADKGPGWTVSLKDAKLTNHTIDIEDRTLDLPARMTISNLSVQTHDVAFPFKGPIPLTVGHRFNETGTVSAEGEVRMQPMQAKIALALKDIAIQPFQPYLERFARIAVDSGAIDLDGEIRFAAEHPKGPLLAFHGNLGIKALAIADRDDATPVAGWKQVQLSEIAVTLDPTTVTIEEVGINQPTVHLVIDQDGIPNIKKLLPSTGASENPPAAERTATPGKKSPPPSITIKTVKVLKGTATFEDESISPRVRTGLYDLTGTVKGLSSKHVARADVDLSAKIDKVAPLKIAGTMNPLTEDAFTDLTMKFDNVDLTAAAPYSGKYAGYMIRKGKLFLDLAYKVSAKQLEAENKVQIDQLTFGEKTDSPDATSLPVPFAVALLKDRNGRIGIDLPIRGDLKDPDFKYGKAVWSTLGNLLSKMVASPFTMMGNLLPGGGDGEELQRLTFEPGSTALAPTEMKKIDALMKGLEERPGLRLEITGTADPARDREAVASQRLQENIRSRWRQENGGTPEKDIPPAAEERIVRQLFEEWRSQQPAGSQPAVAPSQPPTMEEMKRKLAESIRVEDDALRALARTRAEQVQALMVGEGKPPEERVFLTDVDLTTSDHGTVESRLNITAGS